MAKLKPKTRTRSRPIRGDSGELNAVDREILGALTEFRDALADGTVGEKFSIRTLKLDVPTGDYGAADVRGIREGFGLSQAAFALVIGASVKTVHSWEQGRKRPSSIACRFMAEMAADPEYWRGRIRAMVVGAVAI